MSILSVLTPSGQSLPYHLASDSIHRVKSSFFSLAEIEKSSISAKIRSKVPLQMLKAVIVSTSAY